jgi:hypothetical protein
MKLTNREINATAAHEAGHYVAAFGLGLPAFPEVFTETRVMQEGATPSAGLCGVGEVALTAWQGSVIGWAGMLGQAMMGERYPWMPPMKPTATNLEDWYSMMMAQADKLSYSDQRMIFGYRHAFRSCKAAFQILNREQARLRRIAKQIKPRCPIERDYTMKTPPQAEKVSIEQRAVLLEAHLAAMKPDDQDRPRFVAILECLKRSEEPTDNLIRFKVSKKL